MGERITISEPVVGEGWILDLDVYGGQFLSDGMPALRDPFDVYSNRKCEDPYASLDESDWEPAYDDSVIRARARIIEIFHEEADKLKVPEGEA